MSDDLIVSLSLISLQLNRIVPIFQIILGTFGNLINILIFTHRTLRKNPCSLYSLASSINNLFVLYVATLTRLLSSGWNIDPSNFNTILCKLRVFFVYSSLALIQWFMVLTTIDRYLTTCRNVHYRQMSCWSVARKTIGLTILLTCLAHFHILIWWSVDYIGIQTYCNIFDYDYELAFQIFFLIFTCVLPPSLMTLFGILTIVHIKKMRTQIIPQNNHQHLRSKDRQLAKMFLIQILMTIFCTLPFSIANLTTMIFQYTITLSDDGDAINTFYSNLARIINYFNPVIGFYIYAFSSKTFRKEIKCVFNKLIKSNVET